jgi:hypothetical protein
VDVRHRLMNYFAAIGAQEGRVFTLRDFNDQVMMDLFAAEERAGLAIALDAMIEAGVLRRASPTEYSLTPAGLSLVAVMRLNSYRRRTGTGGA